MNGKKIIFNLCLLAACLMSHAQEKSFTVIPLGIYGGADESNLSSYMIAPKGSNDFVCLDAGTLHAGLDRAVKAKLFTQDAAFILKNNIKGYLISHPHLDHLAGMIINSPDDTVKNIYGMPSCLDVIADKYFSWKSWANFADKGEAPALKKYHYINLLPGAVTKLEGTRMTVQAFELSHSNPYKSTAFLVSSDNASVLYLGDTGADEIEKSSWLKELWQSVAPLIKEGQLKGIFIETSFPNEQPSSKLFGHLTPALLVNEMKQLAEFCGAEALSKVSIIITHIKPTGNNEAIIKKQLTAQKELRLKFLFPKQAEKMEL